MVMRKSAKTGLALALFVCICSQWLPADTGSDIFKTRCAVCHGIDGSGNTKVGQAVSIRSLGSAEVQRQSDADLINVISNGRNKMPQFDEKLTTSQIKDLVRFIHTLASTENGSNSRPDYDVQLQNAMALWKNNQLSEASKAAAALIQSNPNRWEGYGLAGAIEKAQNKLSEAKAAYQQALSLAPDDAKPQIMAAIQQIDDHPIGNSNATAAASEGNVSLNDTFDWIQQKLATERPSWVLSDFVCPNSSNCDKFVDAKTAWQYDGFSVEGCKLNLGYGDNESWTDPRSGQQFDPVLNRYRLEVDFAAATAANFIAKELSLEYPKPTEKLQYQPSQWVLELKDPAVHLFRLTVDGKPDPRGDQVIQSVPARIFVTSKELANRIDKAFIHAAELCGGSPKRAEPF